MAKHLKNDWSKEVLLVCQFEGKHLQTWFQRKEGC